MVTTAVLVWSTIGVSTRLVEADEWSILFWRGLVGAPAVLLVDRLTRSASAAPRPWRPDRFELLVALLTAANTILFIVALMRTSVMHASVIYGTVPFFAMIFARLLLREPIAQVAIACAAVASLGITLMVVGKSGEASLAGDAMALATAVAVAILMVVLRIHRTRSPLRGTAIGLAASAATGLVVGAPFMASGSDAAILMLSGLVHSVGGDALFAVGTRFVPAVQSALIGTLETPLAPTWTWFLADGSIDGREIAGGVLVLAAVTSNILISYRQERIDAATFLIAPVSPPLVPPHGPGQPRMAIAAPVPSIARRRDAGTMASPSRTRHHGRQR